MQAEAGVNEAAQQKRLVHSPHAVHSTEARTRRKHGEEVVCSLGAQREIIKIVVLEKQLTEALKTVKGAKQLDQSPLRRFCVEGDSRRRHAAVECQRLQRRVAVKKVAQLRERAVIKGERVEPQIQHRRTRGCRSTQQ